MSVLRRLRDYASSLAGRMAILLAIAIAGASIVSLVVADHVRTQEFRTLQLEHIAASAGDLANRFDREPAQTERLLSQHALFGVRVAKPGFTTEPADAHLLALLRRTLAAGADPAAERITSNCFGDMFDPRNQVAGLGAGPEVDCWRVSFTDKAGVRRAIIVDQQRMRLRSSATLDPVFLGLILVASVAISAFVARLGSEPLRRLTAAARSFSLAMDPEPIVEDGPPEVRSALATFNLMQKRVRDGFRERTQMLAAIAHDLQTPLTKLRLRLEQVKEPVLRDRLIGDLAAMQALVRDGLELARSSESNEAWSIVDISSLVSSLVEDAIELGQPVTLIESCAITARVKPMALTRCLDNLIGNAVKYGGGAELACRMVGRDIEIVVRDHGAGFPGENPEDLIKPFVRGDASRSRDTGGTGIGLTIAHAQARTFGAALTLSNHVDGGGVAAIRFPATRAAAP
jgi:signal transduction histidine kinase